MTNNTLCELLEWDSEFFGLKIARIVPHRLTISSSRWIATWCRETHIDCLYFLADPDDPETADLAQNNGFGLVDIRMQFVKIVDQNEIETDTWVTPTIRYFRSEDLSCLEQIAQNSFHASRFYFDPNFPNDRCDSLYELWIERSCNGYADTVLVAELSDQAVGFISCHMDGDLGHIGLIGVAQNAQGQGLGKQLVNHALKWFAANGALQVLVVTQGRNIHAQRLYQRCGFVTNTVHLWYHWWPEKGN